MARRFPQPRWERRYRVPAATPSYRAGAGEPLVLLHGINASWRIWTPVLSALGEHFDVLAPTAPGHRGGPPVEPGEVSIGALVDGLERALDATGFERAHLVGNSLGGWQAIELGRRGRALSVCALSPAGAWNAPRDLARIVRLLTNARRTIRGGAGFGLAQLVRRPRLRRMAMRAAMEHGERITPAEAVEMLADLAECDAFPGFRTWVATQASLAVADAPQEYPITVAWAECDRTIPFNRYGAPMLDALPGARSVNLPGVGHVPMWDDPGLVVETIRTATRPILTPIRSIR